MPRQGRDNVILKKSKSPSSSKEGSLASIRHAHHQSIASRASSSAHVRSLPDIQRSALDRGVTWTVSHKDEAAFNRGKMHEHFLQRLSDCVFQHEPHALSAASVVAAVRRLEHLRNNQRKREEKHSKTMLKAELVGTRIPIVLEARTRVFISRDATVPNLHPRPEQFVAMMGCSRILTPACCDICVVKRPAEPGHMVELCLSLGGGVVCDHAQFINQPGSCVYFNRAVASGMCANVPRSL